MNNIISRFTKHTMRAIQRARVVAFEQKSPQVKNIHLFHAIAREKGSAGQNILQEMGFKEDSSSNATISERPPALPKNIPFSRSLRETFRQAAKIASSFNYPYIGTEHLVSAILKSNDRQIETILHRLQPPKKHGKEHQGSTVAISGMSGQLPDFMQSMNVLFQTRQKEKQGYNPLEKFATDLNLDNEDPVSNPVVGRGAETDRLISVLMRKTKNNPVLVGDPGVGKTAIVAGLAQRINRGEVPAQMSNKVIYELDLGLLLAGTTFRGEFEQRMKEVIEYVSGDEDIILFIDEIHNLIGAGSAQGSLDAANMLKPALAKGDLRLIGATTFDEYRRHIEKDAALERRFQPIQISEPQEKETSKILRGIKKSYEDYHNVYIDNRAINAAVELSKRYIHDRFLPDKAIDLIDEAQARARSQAISYEITKKLKRCLFQKRRLEELKRKLISDNAFMSASTLKKDEEELNKLLEVISCEQKRREELAFIRITEADIRKVVAEKTGIPMETLGIGTKESALSLEKKLARKIVGQKQAIEAVAKVIQRSSAGIHDPARPIGSFLFLGPTGVGKTSFAKALAEIVYSNPAAFLRIDMSEFGEKHTVSQLIGAPAGYIGYEDGGKLTDRVRRNPYSLILFDEIEKAHPEVFNIFLQILEDGILTDATGRTVSFKNTIIIMTSNLGTRDFIEKAIGFHRGGEATHEKAQKKAEQKLKEVLLPELLNRIDKVITFGLLSPANLALIAKKELGTIRARLKKKRIVINIDPKVYQFIANISHSKREGARLVRKNIEELIQNPLAEHLLKEKQQNRKAYHIRLSGKKIVVSAT